MLTRAQMADVQDKLEQLYQAVQVAATPEAKAAAWGAVEMRIGRPLGSRLYTFYDVGYFEFASPDPLGQEVSTSRGWPKGFGLGLLAKTRAGDISLAVGFPGTVDFDQAKLHVTLLESF